MAHLAYAPDAPPPPPHLLENIRAGVLASGRPVSFPSSPTGSLDAARRRRTDRAGSRGLPRRASALAAAAAAVVLVGGLGVWNSDLRHDRDQQGQQSDRLALAVRTLEKGPSRSVPLLGADSRVMAVAVLHESSVSLVVDGLEPTGRDARYVLWRADRKGALHAVASFDVPDREVDVVRDLPLEGGSAAVDSLAVTSEPRGDGRTPSQPTSAPLATGRGL